MRAWTEAELATHGIIDQAEFEAVAGGLFETSTGNHAIWLVPNGIQSYVFPPNEPGAGVDLLHTDPPEKALDSLAALNTHELVVSLPEATPSSLELRSRLGYSVLPPRALGRLRLSEGVEGRPDPACGPHFLRG